MQQTPATHLLFCQAINHANKLAASSTKLQAAAAICHWHIEHASGMRLPQLHVQVYRGIDFQGRCCMRGTTNWPACSHSCWPKTGQQGEYGISQGELLQSRSARLHVSSTSSLQGIDHPGASKAWQQHDPRPHSAHVTSPFLDAASTCVRFQHDVMLGATASSVFYGEQAHCPFMPTAAADMVFALLL